MKIRHIVKTTYISTNLSVFVRVTHPVYIYIIYPKDYIRMCWTCPCLAELFNFIGLVKLQEYIYLILQISVTIVDW